MNETGRSASAGVLQYQSPPVLDYRSRPIARRKAIGELVVEFVQALMIFFILVLAVMGMVLVFVMLLGGFVGST